MLSIEFAEPAKSACKCCQNVSINLTRFVSKDDQAFAIYYANFTIGHSEKLLHGIVSLGVWGDDSVGPESRLAFPFQIWVKGDNFHVRLVDAEDSPWGQEIYLGRILGRKESLSHEWVRDVFHITDHMVVDDMEIVRYFG